jgi:hypothetical protein
MTGSNAFELTMAQQDALFGAALACVDDIERGLEGWQQPECEDGGQPRLWPVFGWPALCTRWERAERLICAFPNVDRLSLVADWLRPLAEGC